jgi:hypothetical protein
MSGYAFAIGPCIACRQPFTYNPLRVPSSRALTGHREPICRTCFERINAKRQSLGYPPFPDPLPGAYEPLPEEEL